MSDTENYTHEQLVIAALENKTKAELTKVLNDRPVDLGKPYVIAPAEMMEVIDLENHMPAPARTRKLVEFTEAGSFLSYFESFKKGYSPRIFVKDNSEGMKMACVFDYDIPLGEEKDGYVTSPKWNEHVATLALAYHPYYKTLRDCDKKAFAQVDFALFVEENLHLFVAPDSATMLELAQHLKGYKNATWQAGDRLSNGARKLEFVEEIKGVGVRDDVEIPEYIMLKTPMYEGGEDQDIKAAFSWRIDSEGHIFFSYRLLTKVAERKAQEEMKAMVSEKTGLPVLSVSSVQIPGCRNLI